MDRWLIHRLGAELAGYPDPLVVDLGFGASPVTTVELAHRLGAVVAGVRVLGLELAPGRVANAAVHADPPRLAFARGGFELAGRRPFVVRAANVLRQYDEPAAAQAWRTLAAHLEPGGWLVEGTCDELGRVGSWVLLNPAGPLSLTLSCRPASLDQPGRLAERLPKSLIHHNVAGQPIHALLRAVQSAWDTAAPMAAFGARQRWIAACTAVARSWPVLDGVRRWRLGELSVDWAAVAPRPTPVRPSILDRSAS